jgi:predicted nucleic acid-binding protein
MQTFVIDTSVLARYFIDNPQRGKVLELITLAVLGKIKLYAPYLIKYELYSVLIKNKVTKQEVKDDFSLFNELVNEDVIEIIDTEDAFNNGLELAFSNATGNQGYIGANDSYFHGLALALKCDFITNDIKHFNKTKDHFGSVKLFETLQF